MDNELIFNGKHISEFDLIIDPPSIPLLTEDVEEEPVEGRNGNLTIKKGTYKDRVIPINFKLLDVENYWDKLDLILEWLDEIEDNRLLIDRRDRCFRVKRIEFGNIREEILLCGEFAVNFICNPFMEDLEETKIDVTSSPFYVYCRGTKGAETLLKIKATGNIQININKVTMQINNVLDYVEMDSYLKEVRNADGTTHDSLGNFSTLDKGDNSISYTGNVTEIKLVYTNLWR